MTKLFKVIIELYELLITSRKDDRSGHKLKSNSIVNQVTVYLTTCGGVTFHTTTGMSSTYMIFLYVCLVVFCCRHISAELLIYIGNIADNCQQYCRHLSANKLLQPVFNSYQVDGSRIRKSIDHSVCEQCVVISECKGVV